VPLPRRFEHVQNTVLQRVINTSLQLVELGRIATDQAAAGPGAIGPDVVPSKINTWIRLQDAVNAYIDSASASPEMTKDVQVHTVHVSSSIECECAAAGA
jgi:hypothetical protein